MLWAEKEQDLTLVFTGSLCLLHGEWTVGGKGRSRDPSGEGIALVGSG